jgi:hypothetical protein
MLQSHLHRSLRSGIFQAVPHTHTDTEALGVFSSHRSLLDVIIRTTLEVLLHVYHEVPNYVLFENALSSHILGQLFSRALGI